MSLESSQVLETPNIPMLTMDPSPIVTPETPTRIRYENWSPQMKSYLSSRGLWDAIEPSSEQSQNTTVDYETWRRKNAEALTAIQACCDDGIRSMIHGITSAKMLWDTLAKFHQGYNVIDPAKLLKVFPRVVPGYPMMLWYYDNERKRFGPLHQAIHQRDWDKIQDFLKRNKDALTARITQYGSLPIHVAVANGYEEISENLIRLMSKEQLVIQDTFGQTALHLTAACGSSRITKCLVQKNKELVTIPDFRMRMPALAACIGSHKDTALHLYHCTPPDVWFPENGPHGSTLLNQSLTSGMFDIALDVLRRCPRLIITANNWNTIPLRELASMPSSFPSSCRLIFWKQWIYSRIQIQLPITSTSNDMASQNNQNGQEDVAVQVFGQSHGLVLRILKLLGIQEIYEMKLTHVYALEILRCLCREISTLDLEELPQGLVGNALFLAVKNGITEFVIEMIKANPDFVNENDFFGRGIILSAIAERQEKIFNLIYGMNIGKRRQIYMADNYGNSMLHWAAMSPPSRLDRISGAALQMQRELQWFKEVESIVTPGTKIHLNSNGESAYQLFTRNHEQLRKEGEKWMKSTATSCTVVGTLIITIMFTAAFTVPGGNIQETGFPIFLREKSFLVFIISDAISLFASSTSVLTFLGILTSRYAEEDFLKSLPTKLIIGLFMLFFSIATMMIAFCASLIIILDGRLSLVLPIILLASIPVTLFIFLQFPLLVEIFMSTYRPSIFDRKTKHWLS
ncbi:hypothetical protein GH714_005393 [Hevea brasiliensis]|uniref:PGG domain-containing protein n=1 Tax=Hevea brasiliensis TaxID=3981 RepID=A0A6A6N1J7_HEVBR|nr:hypothetical protein GH714_005393 [Hevea brasiliensis]